MITLFLLKLVFGLLHLVVAALPNGDLPAWVTTLTGTVSSAVGQMADMGHWLPLGAIAVVVTFVLVVFGVALVIRVTRMGLSVLTGGGGSAA